MSDVPGLATTTVWRKACLLSLVTIYITWLTQFALSGTQPTSLSTFANITASITIVFWIFRPRKVKA